MGWKSLVITFIPPALALIAFLLLSLLAGVSPLMFISVFGVTGVIVLYILHTDSFDRDY